MRQAIKVLLALGGGLLVGSLGIGVVNAQAGPHTAYVITETKVTDPAGFMEYLQRESGTLAPYHGHTVARALPDVREGAAPDGVVSIVAFDTLQDANRWFNSPEHGKLIALQQKSSVARVYILDGVVK